jgi:hypothetical protein
MESATAKRENVNVIRDILVLNVTKRNAIKTVLIMENVIIKQGNVFVKKDGLEKIVL